MARIAGIPAYRRKNGKAIVSLPDISGNRVQYTLGDYGTPESRAEYARVIAEWQANRSRPINRDITIAELLAAFWEHAQGHYRRPDGTYTSELGIFKLAFRPLKEMYAHTMASKFGPLSLRAVREKFIEGGVSRRVINKYMIRIRHVFKWGASLELIPASIHEALRTVPALSQGRTSARERPPVRPVADEHVDAILPHLRPQTRGIVEVMRHTGMRPGEAVQMRLADIDRSGKVWLYSPRHHKTQWRGLRRVVPIGPKGQAVLLPFLDRDPEAFLFSPREATLSLWQEQRAKRKSKVYPSQKRSWEARLAKLNDSYTVVQLDLAIKRACLKAKVPHWSANQLRHLHATVIRRQFGIEAASSVLGHHHLSVTEVYAEKNHNLAAAVAEKIG